MLLLLSGSALGESGIAEPAGFKMDNYRSATPQTLEGATVVDAIQAKRLHEQGDVVFIDVLPSIKRPEGLSEGEIWLPEERLNIPGSIWLADVGFGALSEDLEVYFKSNLQALAESGSEKLLFYCNADCWMSWNAAKRALQYGYSGVYWFPGGVDEWSDQGFELNPAKAVQK